MAKISIVEIDDDFKTSRLGGCNDNGAVDDIGLDGYVWVKATINDEPVTFMFETQDRNNRLESYLGYKCVFVETLEHTKEQFEKRYGFGADGKETKEIFTKMAEYAKEQHSKATLS